jgi:hypothetical protein
MTLIFFGSKIVDFNSGIIDAINASPELFMTFGQMPTEYLQ